MIDNIIHRLCSQTAVYWGTPVDDGTGGLTFADPVEIACRWSDKSEVIRNSLGVEIVSRSQVWVTQDLDEQGYLYLGTLDDLDSDPVPMDVEGAFQILKFDKIPSIRTTDDFMRKAYL